MSQSFEQLLGINGSLKRANNPISSYKDITIRIIHVWRVTTKCIMLVNKATVWDTVCLIKRRIMSAGQAFHYCSFFAELCQKIHDFDHKYYVMFTFTLGPDKPGHSLFILGNILCRVYNKDV